LYQTLPLLSVSDYCVLLCHCPYRWCLQWGGREEVWEVPRAVQQSDLIILLATHQAVPDPCTNQRGGLMPFIMLNNGTTNHPSSPSYLSEPTIHHQITKQPTNHTPKFHKAAVWSEGSMPKSCCIVNVLVCVSVRIIIILYWNTQCFVFKNKLTLDVLFKCEYIMLHCVTEEQFISFHTTSLNVWFIDMQPFSLMFCSSYEWSFIFIASLVLKGAPGEDLIVLTAWGISQRTILLPLLIDLDRQL
jgi:hypothetical protein